MHVAVDVVLGQGRIFVMWMHQHQSCVLASKTFLFKKIDTSCDNVGKNSEEKSTGKPKSRMKVVLECYIIRDVRVFSSIASSPNVFDRKFAHNLE